MQVWMDIRTMSKTARQSVRHAAPEALEDSIVLEHGAGFLLRVASARANAIFETLTGQTETTPQQYGALLTLHQCGALTPSELADATHTDRSTIGQIIRRLVTRNLVKLSKNGEDGRSKKVTITSGGEALLHRLAQGGVGVQDVLMADVPPQHRPLFMRYLTRMALGGTHE
jgi:DNA-binding MarR family transcriptional regulator